MNNARLILITFLCTCVSHATASFLFQTGFPNTSNDTTFTERRDNAAIGYLPYANRSAYQTISIETEEQYMIRRAEYERQSNLTTMTPAQYCDAYPLDAERCPQSPGLYESVVAIGNRPATTAGQEQPHTPTSTLPPPATPTIAQEATTLVTIQPAPTPTKPTITTPGSQIGKVVGTSADGRTVIANPRTHNGPCTLPQRSKTFSNKILTSGQYAKSDPAFEKIMITTFRGEGGCGNHPNDSGGYTCYGISQNNNPEIDVRNITRADAENIAHRKYYAKYGMDKLPDYIRGDVFTFGWGSGPITGIHQLCRVLKLPKRNKIDAEIVAAVENYNGDLHNDFVDAMQQHLINVSKRGENHVFLKGWMNRVKLTRENSCHYPTTDPITR